MSKELLLSNSKAGVPLPPGAEVFTVAVETNDAYIGFWDELPNSSIQPNTFIGFQITELYCGAEDTELLPGTTLAFQNYQAPIQNVTVIRLDSQLTVKLEKMNLLGNNIYYSYSLQKIFSNEDIGKTVKVALY